jgi:hypothetical protein
MLPEPLEGSLQDPVQQTVLDLSQATSVGPRSHSSELSVEAMFEDLLGKDEVMRYCSWIHVQWLYYTLPPPASRPDR